MTAVRDELVARVEDAWHGRAELGAPATREAVDETIDLLDAGTVRVATRQRGSGWVVNEWVKEAVLLYFRLRPSERLASGIFEYRDKVPLKSGHEAAGVRVVPPAVARYGSYLSPGVVLMPSFVNIGAWVGADTMVDTWATVGSCAQIGARVHLAGGVGIGGVLEPPGKRPVIVEDDAFVGSRCIVVDGVVVGEGAVLGANVVLTQSIPIIDVTGSKPVEVRGEVPPRSVVIPGTRTKRYPAGDFGAPAALIIGRRSAATDAKVSLNEALREFGISP